MYIVALGYHLQQPGVFKESKDEKLFSIETEQTKLTVYEGLIK